MFAQEDNDNCPIRLLKLYLSKRPSDLKNDPNSRFYLRPLVNVNVDTEVWYSHQPLGKNKLGEMMKMMANQAQQGKHLPLRYCSRNGQLQKWHS